MTRVAIVTRNSPGQVADLPPELLPPEAWTSVLNVRFSDGVGERISGTQPMNIPTSPGTAPQTFQIFPFTDASDVNWLLLAGAATIYETDGTTTTNRTGASVPSAQQNRWTYTNFNGIPILNEPSIKPQMRGAPFADLTNWPSTWLAASLRSFKNFLVALDVTKGATRYPNLVAWSSPTTPGAVPASWDGTNPATLAGENPIASNNEDGRVAVVDGCELKDMFIIYKHKSAWVMRLGGPNVFSFDRTLSKGVINRNCILRPTIREEKHVVFGLDDIYVHNGYTEESILKAKDRRWLFKNIDLTNSPKCHAAHSPSTSECWFMYPTIGQTQISHALVWNYDNNNISIVELPDTYWLTIGPFTVPLPGANSWDAQLGAWDDESEAWDASPAQALLPRFLQSAANSARNFFDTGNPSRQALLERQGLAIAGRDQNGQPIYDTEMVKKVTAVWPRFLGTGTITVQLGASDNPSAPVQWGEARQFDTATRSKVDYFIEGRILHARFTGVDTGQWRMLGYDLEMEPVGRERGI